MNNKDAKLVNHENVVLLRKLPRQIRVSQRIFHDFSMIFREFSENFD